MDFDPDNSLIIIEDERVFNWDQPRAPLFDVPTLSDTDGLPPLPDSLSYYYTTPPPKQAINFDDIDLDAFTWDECSNMSSSIVPSTYYDAVPLNIVPNHNKDNPNGGGEMQQQMVNSNSTNPTGGRSSRSTQIGFEEIRRHFCMPITRAAKELNVGLTVLKKRCRELGIPRWPHRKIKSLKSLISSVQELGMVRCEEGMRRELETLEEQRRRMEENPLIQLTESTKKLRQFCFKANYKRRRGMLMQHPYFDDHNRMAFIQY